MGMKWRDKLEGEHPSHGKIVGILIPRPLDVDALVRTVPKNRLVTDEQLRTELARGSGADVTCSKVMAFSFASALRQRKRTVRRGGRASPPTGGWFPRTAR